MAGSKRISTPLNDELIAQLHAGDNLLISGTIYTGRDAAHKKLMELIEKGEKLPLELEGPDHFLRGTDSGPARQTDRVGRTDHQLPHGRLRAQASRTWSEGHDGQRVAQPRGQRGVEKVQSCLPGRDRRCRRPGLARASKKPRWSPIRNWVPRPSINSKWRIFPAQVINDMYGGDIYEEGRRRYERK